MTRSATALIVFVGVSISALAAPAPRKRSVELEISLPKGGAPRVIVREDEGAVVRLPDGARFGFVPTMRNGEDTAVVVGIWDVDRVPFNKLGSVEVEVGGPLVRSDTSPAFGIRVIRVIKPK